MKQRATGCRDNRPGQRRPGLFISTPRQKAVQPPGVRITARVRREWSNASSSCTSHSSHGDDGGMPRQRGTGGAGGHRGDRYTRAVGHNDTHSRTVDHNDTHGCQGRWDLGPLGRSKSVPAERSLASVNVRASCRGEVSQRQASYRLVGE